MNLGLGILLCRMRSSCPGVTLKVFAILWLWWTRPGPQLQVFRDSPPVLTGWVGCGFTLGVGVSRLTKKNVEYQGNLKFR